MGRPTCTCLVLQSDLSAPARILSHAPKARLLGHTPELGLVAAREEVFWPHFFASAGAGIPANLLPHSRLPAAFVASLETLGSLVFFLQVRLLCLVLNYFLGLIWAAQPNICTKIH